MNYHRAGLALSILILLACVTSISSAAPEAPAPKKAAPAKNLIRQFVKPAPNGMGVITGAVSPLDLKGENFYLILDGRIQVEVKLNTDAKIGLMMRGISKEMYTKRCLIDSVTNKRYPLPKDLYVKVTFPDWKTAQTALSSGTFTDGMVHANVLAEHLPTEKEPWLCGKLVGVEKGKYSLTKVVSVGDKTFKGDTEAPNRSDQIVGMLTPKAIVPFVNLAMVYGKLEGEVFHASHVLLPSVKDRTAKDDPKLPRYMFIGDSISGNYSGSLRKALMGKYNIHHPPTNCGPASKGRASMALWLGDYKTTGRNWDVISFNFGHWNVSSSKKEYQDDLEAIVQGLKKTGAKLIWVTTCPVPRQRPVCGELVEQRGKGLCAPGRKTGVMAKYINPWALEVMKRHPEVTICDQYKVVKDGENGLFKEWWKGGNVHFKGEESKAIGELLAKHVETVMKKK